MKWLLAAAGAIVIALVALGGYAYFTPHLALKRIQSAANAGDTRALEELVDFPAVKSSLKRQIRARIDEGTARSANPLAAFGSALASALADPAVETLATSENVAGLLRGENLGPGGGPRVHLDDASLELGYDGLDRFTANATTAAGFSFVLERDGPFAWKLTEVLLPSNWRMPNVMPKPAQ